MLVKRFEAVLFDFGHTLFDTIDPLETVELFRESSGTVVGPESFVPAWRSVRERARAPDELAKGRDLSAAAHRACWLSLLSPLDDLAPGLAAFVYELETSARGWRPYPDTREVLGHLSTQRVPVGVVSDCGSDIRSIFRAHDLDRFIGAYSLSLEVGACKPGPRPFLGACHALGARPERCLMVGDNWLTDGGAASLGIETLILPQRDRTGEPALSSVLALLGGG